MFRNFKPDQPYFYGVAMAIIIVGSLVLAIGLVELICNLIGNFTFAYPSFKVVAGLAIIALGYIHLELELLRIKKN